MWDLVGHPEDPFSHNEAHILQAANNKGAEQHACITQPNRLEIYLRYDENHSLITHEFCAKTANSESPKISIYSPYLTKWHNSKEVAPKDADRAQTEQTLIRQLLQFYNISVGLHVYKLRKITVLT